MDFASRLSWFRSTVSFTLCFFLCCSRYNSLSSNLRVQIIPQFLRKKKSDSTTLLCQPCRKHSLSHLGAPFRSLQLRENPGSYCVVQWKREGLSLQCLLVTTDCLFVQVYMGSGWWMTSDFLWPQSSFSRLTERFFSSEIYPFLGTCQGAEYKFLGLLECDNFCS